MGGGRKEIFLRGMPICSGIAIGDAFIFAASDDIVPKLFIAPSLVDKEIKRYRSALRHSKKDILILKKKLEGERLEEGAAMLATHLEIIDDPILSETVENAIRNEHRNAEHVFHEVIDDYEEKFNRITDEFFRERFRDTQDVSRRIMRHLRKNVSTSFSAIPENSIVFAKDLLLSDVAEVKRMHVSAFVTKAGSETSHAAIIAKAKGIPYVSGVDVEAMGRKVKGSQVIVDGRKGGVIINPSEETLRRYRALERELIEGYSALELIQGCETKTSDGDVIRISANVDVIGDVKAIYPCDDMHIGLFRSEYMLLQHDAFPTEEEQYLVYKELVNAALGNSVTIRTFDIGGDKVAFMDDISREANPFLGCRAIRLMLREPDIFMSQLRAILRASAFGTVRILFPMVSGYGELLQAKQFLLAAKKSLREKNILYDDTIKVGCMIEVPSAAIMCDILAKECDFFSIGTNDLVQYTLAVDRGNHDIDYLYRPSHPSVMRFIQRIVEEGRKSNVPVSLCGEMAADPRFTALLIGLGVDDLSVAVRHIPIIKNMVRFISAEEARRFSRKILEMASSEEIKKAIDDYYQRIVAGTPLETVCARW